MENITSIEHLKKRQELIEKLDQAIEFGLAAERAWNNGMRVVESALEKKAA